MTDPKLKLRKIWGALLFAAGLGMFVTIPEKIQDFEAQGKYFFGMKPAFYLVSVLLMIGGGKKLFQKSGDGSPPQDDSGR